MDTTARGAFPYPTGPDNWKQLRAQIKALADRIAAVGALFIETTASLRPVAGTFGRFHRATDSGVLSIDTGTAWQEIPTVSSQSGFAELYLHGGR